MKWFKALLTKIKLMLQGVNVMKLSKYVVINTLAVIDNIADSTEDELKAQMHGKLVKELAKKDISLPAFITETAVSKTYKKLVKPIIDDKLFKNVEGVVDLFMPELDKKKKKK